MNEQLTVSSPVVIAPITQSDESFSATAFEPSLAFEDTASVYDGFAGVYDLMFRDWEESGAKEAARIQGIITANRGDGQRVRILDPVCGIGKPALNLAEKGYIVTGCDISPGSIERARREARRRGIDLCLRVADILDPGSLPTGEFDVVIILGNSLCTLTGDNDIVTALTYLRTRVRPGGIIIAGIRDYGPSMKDRPLRVDAPTLCLDQGKWRIVHQLWRWIDETRYDSHVYIDTEAQSHHHIVRCRAVFPDELAEALTTAGFVNVQWLSHSAQTASGVSVYETGFDQLLVTASVPH